MAEKKRLWMRLGVTVELSLHDAAVILGGGVAGRNLLRQKFENGEFYLDGDSYIPETRGLTKDDIPVAEEVEYSF